MIFRVEFDQLRIEIQNHTYFSGTYRSPKSVFATKETENAEKKFDFDD